MNFLQSSLPSGSPAVAGSRSLRVEKIIYFASFVSKSSVNHIINGSGAGEEHGKSVKSKADSADGSG